MIMSNLPEETKALPTNVDGYVEINGAKFRVGCCLIKRDEVHKILVISEDGFTIPSRYYEDGISSISWQDYDNYYNYCDTPYEEIEKLSERLLRGELDMSEYLEDKKESTELMVIDTQAYVALRDRLALQASAISAFTAQAQLQLKARMNELKAIADEFRGKIKKLNKIIWTLELYMGIEEDIYHIQAGIDAPNSEVIKLMQERLYIDEEVGDPTDGGIDIRTIEDFDAWLLQKSGYWKKYNYELLMPFNKCVRIMRLRRKKKERDDRGDIRTAFMNANLAIQDMQTYMLVRNGSNIYSIRCDMNFGEKLFPSETELLDMQEDISNDESDKDHWQRRSARQKEDEFLSTYERYQRNIIILQGLIERTPIFGDTHGVNLFKPGGTKDVVEFVYEDALRIGDGQQTAIQWYHDAKEGLTEGCRALVFSAESAYHYRDKDDPAWEFFKFPWNVRKTPARPDLGIYTLYYYDPVKEEGKHGSYEKWYIKYLPEDTVYTGDWYTGEEKQRTKRVAISLDCFSYINFDMVTHRNIDDLWRLMHSREDRRNYLTLMPALMKIRGYKLEELEKELPFAQLVMMQNNISLLSARDYIHWWKTKNKWKRTLEVDDKKALRMIQKQVKRDR